MVKIVKATKKKHWTAAHLRVLMHAKCQVLSTSQPARCSLRHPWLGSHFWPLCSLSLPFSHSPCAPPPPLSWSSTVIMRADRQSIAHHLICTLSPLCFFQLLPFGQPHRHALICNADHRHHHLHQHSHRLIGWLLQQTGTSKQCPHCEKTNVFAYSWP